MNDSSKLRGVSSNSSLKICSYPRSGSNFFSHEFEARTGVKLPVDHGKAYGDGIFSCIRGPMETLASGLAMSLETNMQKTIANVGLDYYEKQVNLFNEDDINARLDYTINDYKLFYSYLDQSKNAIVDYETYRLNIKSSIAKAASFFEIELLPGPAPADLGVDNPLNGYLVSSKSSSEFYQRSLEMVSKKDLTQANALYQKCLQKSILSGLS